MNTLSKHFSKINYQILLLSVSCGLIVANLYYAQPLLSLIGQSLNLSSGASGLIVTFTQIGYVIGLLFIVPISDLKENLRLVTLLLILTIFGLLLATFTKSSILFFIAVFLIGLGSVAAQILVPYASYLASFEKRGEVVGHVMSGLLLGIMLARPLSSLMANYFGWQSIFIISAIAIVILLFLLRSSLSKRVPQSSFTYQEMIQSLWELFSTIPILRQRAFYQACLFGSFSLFWTVVPMWLMTHFHLSQSEIALFSFAGVTGAIAAPIAGKLADKGFAKKLTGFALVLASFSFLLTRVFFEATTVSLILFLIAAILLDMAVSGNLILSQHIIFALGDDIRGRVNGLFMAAFFLGGALGSGLGSFIYAKGGWNLASLLGLFLPVLAFLYYLTDLKYHRTIISRNKEVN